MRKGSLTVFFSLIMVSVMTLMFTMAELVRVYALSSITMTVTEGAAESGFSEYNRVLWEKYKILGIDLSFGAESSGPTVLQDKISDIASTNASVDGLSFERLKVEGVSVSNYSVLTDNNGAGVIEEGIKAAKSGLASYVIDELYADRDSVNIESKNPDSQINVAKDELADKSNDSEEYEKGELEDNPLDAYDAMKEAISGGILKALAVPENEISAKEIDISNAPSKRRLSHGNSQDSASITAGEHIIYGQYLIDNFSYFRNSKSHNGLDYEVEYIIGGKDSDKENLAAVAERMLLIREGINIACIASTPSLLQQVSEAAAVLTGGNPALLAVVEPALIAAWAYAESLLEVRTLFDNGKVAYIKNVSNWNSDLLHLSSVISGGKAANIENGISYEAYLRCIIAAESAKKLGLRTCDVMENELHTEEDYKSMKLDYTLYKGDVSINYRGSEMFLSVFKIPGKDLDGYRFSRKVSMSY